MSGTATSPRLDEVLSWEGIWLRPEMRPDRRVALHAAVTICHDHGIPFIVGGRLAVELHVPRSCPSMSIRILADRSAARMARLREAWESRGYCLSSQHKSAIRLQHLSTRMPLEIHFSPAYIEWSADARVEPIDDMPVGFMSPLKLGLAALRTQVRDVPGYAIRQLEDRIDLMSLLLHEPLLGQALRADPMLTAEMSIALEEVLAQLGSGTSDELPPPEGDEDDDA